MKKKIIGITACLIMIVACIAAVALTETEGNYRYHQHLEALTKPSCRHTEKELCTHLPLVSISTGNQTIPGRAVVKNDKTIGYTKTKDGSDRIAAEISVYDSDSKNNHITDSPAVSSDITIHVRGNSSRSFDKAGYRIKLIKPDGTKNPQSIMGMAAHEDWVLHGPFLDKTLIRNYMWYNIAGEIMDYAPNVRFCELVIDGEYMGVYVMTEAVTAGDDTGRINISADPEENFLSGYVLLLDRLDGNEYNQLKSFTTYTLRTRHKLEIVYPGEKRLTPGLYEKIKKDFSAFEKTLYSYDYNDKKYGISRLIDAESFADYFIINEFTCNYDAGWLSTYIYKDADGRFRMCIWDFNSACDNYQQSQMDSQHFEMQNCLWYFMLMKDEDFTELCIKRYRQLRKTVLSEEYLNRYIDDTVSYLGTAIERNYEKWGYSFNKKHDMLRPQSRNPRTYGQSIEQMKKFIKERGEWMDDNIESLRQYSAPSKIKKFNEVAN